MTTNTQPRGDENLTPTLDDVHGDARVSTSPAYEPTAADMAEMGAAFDRGEESPEEIEAMYRDWQRQESERLANAARREYIAEQLIEVSMMNAAHLGQAMAWALGEDRAAG